MSKLLIVAFMLISIIAYSTDYYSQNNGNFSNVSIWNTLAGGGGSQPTLAELQNGLHDFIIQSSHEIVLNADIDVNNLTLSGTSKLLLGNSTTARSLSIRSILTVGTNTSIAISVNNAIHSINLYGNIINNGSIDLYNNSAQVAELNVNGTVIHSNNTMELYHLNLNSGSFTAATNLTIYGNVSLATGTTFNGGSYTHSVYGNWFEYGSGNLVSTGIINFKSASVQTINTNSIFNSLTLSGGGVLSVSANIIINGNLNISNNSTFLTANAHIINGNLVISTGSKIQTTGGSFSFNGTSAQSISPSPTTEFNNCYFQNGGSANPKTIIGNLIVKNETRIYGLASVGGTGDHSFDGNFRLMGECTFSGSLTFTSGTILDTDDDNLTLGTADIIIDGYIYIAANDIVNVYGNVIINNNYLVINNGAELRQLGANKSLTITTGTTLYLRGANSLPTGFSSIDFQDGSTARYDGNLAQVVEGGLDYYNLYLRYDNKTINGNLNIDGNLTLEGGVNANFGAYAHTLEGHLINGNNSNLVSTGSFTFDAPDANQNIWATAAGSYTFNNLIFTNTNPTAKRTKNIDKDIVVNGDFSITNGSTNSSLELTLDIDANSVTNDIGDEFTLGENIRLRSSGNTSLSTGLASFATVSLHNGSIVHYDGTNQEIAAVTYGNLSIYGNGSKTLAGDITINSNLNRTGGTAQLIDAGHTISIYGDWSYPSSLTTGLSGTVELLGANQIIKGGSFNNLSLLGSATKTLSSDISIGADLTVAANVTFDANDENIVISGNWLQNPTSIFTQTIGRTTFTGTTDNISLVTNANSYFGDFFIDKASGNKTIIANSDIHVKRHVNFAQNNAILNLNGNDMYTGGNWYYRTGTGFTHGNGKLYFNGDNIQYIYNYQAIVIQDIEFSGIGQKYIRYSNLDVDGDLTINGSNLNCGSYDVTINIAGDWINTGTFTTDRAVYFDGTTQSIGASTFHDVYISNSGTKTLNGNISLDGAMVIEDGTKLDVSASNYSIIVEEGWNNSGTGEFIMHEGSVNFVGGISAILTGGSSVNKQFYNLNINLASNGRATITGDILIQNNFNLSNGYFRTGIYNMTVGGDFINTSGLFEHNDNASTLTLNASSGAKIFNPGNDSYRNIVINAPSASYTLTGGFNMITSNSFTIDNGSIDFNGQSILLGTLSNIDLNAGILNISEGTNITFGSRSKLINNGGSLNIIGTVSNNVQFNSNQTNKNYYYQIIQTAGSIAANHYRFEKTGINGVDIQGGTLDAVNNFSNGIFLNGGGNDYLKLSGLDFGAGITIDNISFGSGPNYNVERTTGNGTVTFTNFTGGLAGATYEHDHATNDLIKWTAIGNIYWTGAVDNNWNISGNWSPAIVPGLLNDVVLDHSSVSGSYTIDLNTTDAKIKSLDIQGAANAITLNLNGANLEVTENIQVATNDVLGILQANDIIKTGGNFAVYGSLNATTGTVVLMASSGTNTLNCISPFYNLKINANGATYLLANNIDVNNDIDLIEGALDVSSSNYSINVGGDWSLTNASFNAQNGAVNFDADGGQSQQIGGGAFYDLNLSNGTGIGTSTKVALSNITILDDININANTTFNAGTNIVFVGDDWLNYAGVTGFSQTGGGTVIFNGTTQIIGDYATSITTFNNIYFQGTSNKEIRYDINVIKELTISSGLTYVIVHNGVTVDGIGASNILTQNGSYLSIRGVNNFPINFEQLNLTGGIVDYYADFDQNIYPTTYNAILLRHATVGSSQTKTFTGDIVVNQNITINDADTKLDVNDKTLTVIGALSKVSLTPAIDWGTGTYIWENIGNASIDPEITNFNNFIINASGTKYLRNNLTITGDVSILNSAILSSQYNNINYTMNAAGAGQKFTIAANCRYYAYDQASVSKAFPQNYANYNLDINSSVYIRAIGALNGAQTIYTSPIYGNLYIWDNIARTITLDGNLIVKGDLKMTSNLPALDDNTFNINVAGPYIDLRNYTPTSNSVFTLDGANQSIYDNSSNVNFEWANVIFAGTGIKSIKDKTTITGDLLVNSGVTIANTQTIDFSGDSWINNGAFNCTGGSVNMISTSAQSINPGANHKFNTLTFSEASTKTIISNGLDVNGLFTINSGTVDFGALTHYIASATMVNSGTIISNLSDFYFDNQIHNQTLCALTAKDVYFTTTNTTYRTLTGDWNINNLNIGNKIIFRTSNVVPGKNITLSGNWINNGTFQAYNNTVSFESKNTTAKTIATNGHDFYNLEFNQTLTNSCNYTATTAIEVDENLTIGNGASLMMGSNTLTLGDNANIETHTVQAGGKLSLAGGSSLLLNTYVANAILNVDGELSLVGSAASIVNISKAYGNYRLDININGKIAAKYYHFQYLVDQGLDINSGATIDAVNNLSEGSFSNININASIVRRYINFKNNTSSLPTINNITFNFTGTPTLGKHYNVRKDPSSAGDVTFAGSITGPLAGVSYEDDGGNKVFWPNTTEVQWIGSIDQDWFKPGNWSPATVPTALIDAIIPSASNYPIINTANANCKNLNLTNGILSLDAGYNLNVAEDVSIGLNNGSAILSVANPSSELFVGGDWTCYTNGVFTHGNAKVSFTKPTGLVSITPKTSAFNDVELAGAASFNFIGSVIDFNGDFNITAGEFFPKNNNYILNVSGDFLNTGGIMNNSVTGTFKAIGSSQAFANLNVSKLEIKGTAVKNMAGTNIVSNTMDILSRLTMMGTIEMKNRVTIHAGATFNDGGQIHIFSGNSWYGTGSYLGVGTVKFVGIGNQNIYASNFNSLSLMSTGRIYLKGDIELTGNLTISNSINELWLYDKLITNTSGNGILSLEAPEVIRVSGTDNFPKGFANYYLDDLSAVYYNGATAQLVAGITYGRIYLENDNVKTLSGDMIVKSTLNFNNSTLDVSASNYSLEAQGHWNNNLTGSFICRQGEVILSGSLQYQNVYVNSTGITDFYDLKIDRSVGYSRILSNNVNILNKLWAYNGMFTANSFNVTVGGDMIATNGTFYASGKYILNKANGTAILQFNGSTLNNIEINSANGATIFELQDNLKFNGNLDVVKGIFNGNGMVVDAGNSSDIMTIAGTYILGAGGELNLGSNSSFNVTNTGIVEVVGTIGNPAIVSNINGRYYFNVEGLIKANYYEFNYMASSGIFIKNTAQIDVNNNFSNGTFTRGVGGGTMLRIENSQSLTGANRIENISFSINPGSGAYNVTKSTATSGTIEFYAATGSFSGASFENDPNSLIDWSGDIMLTWNGSVNSNWFNANNWTASSGPSIVPTGAEDVVIVLANNQPQINASGAITKTLDINNGAVLTMNSSAGATTDLHITANLDLQGTLIMNANDILELDGDWDRATSGNFSCGEGLVIMKNTTSSAFIKNGSVPFYNLTIDNTSSVDINSSTMINNDFTIEVGDVNIASSNFTVTVSGNFKNNGTYTHNNSKVILRGQSASTKTFDAGNSSFYKIEVNAGASTVYELVNRDLVLTNGLNIIKGTFDLGNQDMFFGNGSSADKININGTLILNDGISLHMENASQIIVNSGGEIQLVSSNASSPVSISNQGSGNYAFTVNSGGKVAAKNYAFSHLNANGIYFRAGSIIDATNNMSFGTFSNGKSGGTYLKLQNNFSDFTATEIVFNSGATYNVTRTSATGIISLEDATGTLAGHLFENDDNGATTGRIRWTYTSPQISWTGAINSDWSNLGNWNGGLPNINSNITIPIVGSGNYPIISNSAAEVLSLSIESGASLNIQNNKNLTIDGDITNNGTLTIANNSNSTIYVDDKWNCSGIFTSGNSSSVEFTASTGVVDIEMSGSSFNNLVINSSNNATYQSASSLSVSNDLIIMAGTFKISNASHSLSVGGDISNNATLDLGTATLTLDGASQDLSSIVGESVSELILSGTGTKFLSTNLVVNGDITIGASTILNGGNSTLSLKGYWYNNGSFTYGTSTVALIGSSIQGITGNGEQSFYNLTINNSSSAFPQVIISKNVRIKTGGVLTLTDGVVQTTFSKMLTMESGTSVMGGNSSNSYIDGPMTKIGNQNFVFPIGDGTIFARLGISDMASSSTFVASYFDAPYSNIISLDEYLAYVSPIEFWDLSRSSGVAEPNVTLYWESGSRSGIQNIEDLRVGHFRNNAMWNVMGGATNGNLNSGSIVSTIPFSTFSPITFASIGAALPVEMLYFEGENYNNDVLLQWATATELNNDYFIVERSADAVNFEAIGTVDGNGTVNVLTQYNFVDSKANNGVNYYRLRQVDFDGKYTFTNIVAVTVDGNEKTMSLYPNPVNGNFATLKLEGTQGMKKVINIYSSLGVVCYKVETTDNEIRLPVASLNLQRGMYIVSVETDGIIMTKKLSVQ